MAINFIPTQSKEIFIGRQDQRDVFAQILDGTRPEWVIHIPGKGGIGKTRLLERFREDACLHGSQKIVATHLIDFYNTFIQTGLGLLLEISRVLGEQYFLTFVAERESFYGLLQTEADPAERQEAYNRVTAAFLVDYDKFIRQGLRPVLLMDTCEEMHGVEGYVLHTLLTGIAELEDKLRAEAVAVGNPAPHPQTTVVIAGRKNLTFPPELIGQVLVTELPTLTREEAFAFFERAGIIPARLNQEEAGELYELTAGRPLYLALSHDWLVNEVGTLEELLDQDEPFGQKLVSWVRRLRGKEGNAILYAALAWRRMEPSLLAHLLQVGEAEGQKIIDGLSRFSFAKYRPAEQDSPGAFQLHDEMRELVNQFVWPQEGKLTQDALLAQVAEWYEQRIGDPDLVQGEKPAPNDETRALLAEWLFYQSRIDLDRGFVYQERLFRRASHYLDLAFCELLNQEIVRFERLLSPEQQDDLRFRQALVAFRRDQVDQASAIWHSLLRRSSVRPVMRATTLAQLVELDSYSGRPDEAVEHAAEGEQVYLRLVKSEQDPKSRERLSAELGQLYNNWGYALRVKGDPAGALEYYEKALEMPGRQKNVARTLNNMGYIYYQRGNFIQARTFVGRSLQIRNKLGIPYESGLAYNTMGIIMEESSRWDHAADLYYKALLNFQAARSERGRALVLVNLGRVRRITNDWEKALQDLKEARGIFERLMDKDHLAQALNELGCLYRQRATTEFAEVSDWEQAQQLLEESLALNNQVGRQFEAADDWEDLSILHSLRSREELRRKNVEQARLYAGQARKAAMQVQEIAKKENFLPLVAMSERTLGNLAYDENDYVQAFDHYFQACRLMATALRTGTRSPVQMQRRFEETMDRLQEQLQALADVDEGVGYARKLLEEMDALPAEEQERLQVIKAYLDAAIVVAQKARSVD